MPNNLKLIVCIGADPTIKLHRHCKRNWQNYFDYIDFENYYFTSRSLTLDSDLILPNEFVFSLPEDLRKALSESVKRDGVYHSDYAGEYGLAVIHGHQKLLTSLLRNNDGDFIMYSPSATSVIDIEQIKTYIQEHYKQPGHFYGGAPVPIIHWPTSSKFWFISGSGLMMSRATIELLLTRLNDGLPRMTEDLLYAILLEDLPRHIICRQSLAVTKSIAREYDAFQRQVQQLREQGHFCFRINSSGSKELVGGRDLNDSLLHSLVFNVLLKDRHKPARYISDNFRNGCTQIGVEVNGVALPAGKLYFKDSEVVNDF
jgi:hypothetical protein